MTRRYIGLFLIFACLMAPLAADTQPIGKVWRIGVLASSPPAVNAPFLEAFWHRLRELGYVEGQNLAVESRWSHGQVEAVSALAVELVRLPVREVSPRRVSRVGVVFNPMDVGNVLGIRELEGPTRALGMTLKPIDVRSPDAFEGAFARMASEGVEAVVVLAGPLTNTHVTQLVHLTARTRLPAIYGRRDYVEAGGLMSYGVDFPDMNHRAATYVDKILKGAKPADLPVEQPMSFELVINLKTAKDLGLTIPPALLFQATEVIR